MDRKEDVAKIKMEGCILFSVLFNPYRGSNALRFADGIAFYTELKNDLKNILINVNE